MSKTLVVVGQGYVGLPMALRAAEVGLKVHGLDTNSSTVSALNSGVSHIDDVSDHDLAAGLANGYEATDDPSCIANADVVVVCVPTPLAAEGGTNPEAADSARAWWCGAPPRPPPTAPRTCGPLRVPRASSVSTSPPKLS